MLENLTFSELSNIYSVLQHKLWDKEYFSRLVSMTSILIIFFFLRFISVSCTALARKYANSHL